VGRQARAVGRQLRPRSPGPVRRRDARRLEARRNFIPRAFDFALPIEPLPHNPARAKQLLAEAGYPNGFDAGELYQLPPYFSLGEAIIGNLQAVGIKLKMRPMERAAFTKEYGEKKYRNLIQGGSGAFGNAATRMETFVVKGGTYVYGSYPDIDELFVQHSQTTDPAKRTELLHRMQQLLYERSVYAPLWQLGFLHGQGRRVADPAFNLISGHPYSAPYEDVRLKGGA